MGRIVKSGLIQCENPVNDEHKSVADIQAFAAVSGDTNPAHLNSDYANDTLFHGVIAHGMWAPLFWITLAQVLINLYPIMHLRLTRHRLGALVSRRRSRRQARVAPEG